MTTRHTSVELVTLLLIYYTDIKTAIPNSPSVLGAIGKWERDGMIEADNTLKTWVVTAKGSAFVDHLCGTPLPKQETKFIIPERKPPL